MRTNHSKTIAVVVVLSGIVFLWGCSSERKADAPPPTVAQNTEKTAAEPKVMSPAPEPAAEPRPGSAVEEKPKAAKAIRPKMAMKRSLPPKLSAEPAQTPNIASPPPAESDEVINPMRGPRSAPSMLSNPMRSETPPEGERFSESPALPPDDSDLPIGKKLFMRETEGEEEPAAAAMDDSMKMSPDEAEFPDGPGQPAPVEADDSEKEKTSPAESEYTVVKVFYGTDRAPINAPDVNQSVYSTWLIRTIFIGVATFLLSILGFRYYPSRSIRGLAYCGMIATTLLAATTIYARFHSIFSGDSAKASLFSLVSYGADRGKLELGTCEVSIPKSHEVGELESPSVIRLEIYAVPSRHVMLLGVHPEPAERFYSDLRECVGRSSRKSAFVFVHGYNTNFNDAARRTAQIAYDLKFDGAPIFYSWPSQGGLLQYTVDETNVAWTAPHLLRFLTDVAEQSGAERIHLVAHSMGNRALTSALRDLSLLQKSSKPLFNEVILTAPDIDADVFMNDIAPAIVKTAKRVTLYASSNDEALIMSKKVHGYPRAGDSGNQLIVIPGVDTVDVSAIDTSLLGHNYYGDSSSVLADIFELLHASKPADQRQWLHSRRLGLLKYWEFLP